MKKLCIALLICSCIFSGSLSFAAPIGSIDGYSWDTAQIQVNMPEVYVPEPEPAPQPETAPTVNTGAGTEIGRASTTYSESSSYANRNQNMLLATQAIHGVVIQPGEIFSYNNTLGPRTAERGYKVATIFQGGKKVPGLGGGICQISSTLYMATKRAGLEIVERYPHSLPVSYCSRDDEATVSWGTLDYRFKNSLSTPIRIDATMYNGVCEIVIQTL